MYELLPVERILRWPDETVGKAGRKHAIKYAYLLRAIQTPGFWHVAQSYNTYMSAFQAMNRLRTSYAPQLPELKEGQSWEFRVGRELEVAQEMPSAAFQTAGIGSHLVMARVAPLGHCEIDPNVNSWITCLPNILLSHMAATNSPGNWIYIGWKKSYNLANIWKSDIQMKYYNLLPPRSKSVLIPDFEYGFAQTKTSGGDPKHEIYVKYNPARVQVVAVSESGFNEDETSQLTPDP